MSDSTLSYFNPKPPHPPRPSASFAVASSLCIGIPIFGAAIRNGPLFLLGGLFSPLVGFMLGLIGLFRSQRSGAGLIAFCSMALGANALVGGYFFWLIFVHGLC